MKLSQTVKDIFKYSDLSVPDQGTSRKPPRKRSKTGKTESQMLIFNLMILHNMKIETKHECVPLYCR